MDADGCRWVQMMRVGALLYNNDKVGVRWAREGVDMHDLGARVAGKFPDIMLRHILPKKTQKRATITYNMDQAPHKSCMQPNKSNRGPTTAQNSHKRTKPGNNNFGRNTETEN